MKGRKPKPIELRREEGNPGKRPLPDPVVIEGRVAVPEQLQAPAHLGPQEVAAWEWIVPRLIEVGMLDKVDALALEGAVTAVARARQARSIIESEGMTTTTDKGTPVVHPAIRIERDSWRTFLTFAEHYGLTALARTRLGLAEVARRTLQQELADGLPALDPERMEQIERGLVDAKDEVRAIEAEATKAKRRKRKRS